MLKKYPIKMLCKFQNFSEEQYHKTNDKITKYCFGTLHDISTEELKDANIGNSRRGIFLHDLWGSDDRLLVYDDLISRIKGDNILLEKAEEKNDKEIILKARINKNLNLMIFDLILQYTFSGKRKKEMWPNFSRTNANELYNDIVFMMNQDSNKNEHNRMLMYYFINYTLATRFGLKEYIGENE